MEERIRADRERMLKNGPPDGGVWSSGDPVQDVRALAAAASVTDS
jgi:hypothetical protein